MKGSSHTPDATIEKIHSHVSEKSFDLDNISNDDTSITESGKALFKNAAKSRPCRGIMREAYPRIKNGLIKRDVPGFDR